MIILDRSSKRASEDYRKVLDRALFEVKRHEASLETADESANSTSDAKRFNMSEIMKKRKAFHRAQEAGRIVPSSLFVSMVSQFDAYFSKLAKGLFALRPEKLKSIKKTISLSEMVSFRDLKDLKSHLLDVEIDETLRNSHLEQLKWLGNKFDFSIEEDDPLIAKYIEVTERRNLWVHAEGNASNDYIEIVRGLGLQSEIKLGTTLSITRSYMESAHATLYELAVRLSQIAWRNSRRDQLREQDIVLQEITYDLLKDGRYALARSVLDFASTVVKVSDEQMRRMFCINRAIACKFGGQETQVTKILAKFDWSATAPKYKLALLILEDKFDEAITLLPNIPVDHESGFTIDGYRDWPLFRGIRSRSDFQIAFETKFGEPLEEQNIKNATEEGKKELEGVEEFESGMPSREYVTPHIDGHVSRGQSDAHNNGHD